MKGAFASVRLLDAPLSADRAYTYAVPPHLLGVVCRGLPVRVPFGRGSRVAAGVVTGLSDTCERENLKSVLSAFDPVFCLSEEMLAMADFLCEHTLCTMGDAVRAILPPGAVDSRASVRCERTVYPLLSRDELRGICDGVVRLRSAAHRAVLLYFCDDPTPVSQRALCDALSVTPAQIRALVDRGWLAYGSEEVVRNPYAALGRERDTSPICLSRAQTEAYETLQKLQKDQKPHAALLFGVTGSGKTKVFMRVMDDVIREGKQVILMVPEIALTPQTVSIFCRRYGTRVAVIHSALSFGERLDAWRRIRAGEVDLVIGTRSAVFAPLDRLGLIVVDEEHEHTYKSESAPKYHARDVAAFRCGASGALLILSSATPSFESFYKAREGRYTLVPLRERYGGATLPEVQIVDMRTELRAGRVSPVSLPLFERLAGVKERGEQAILFLNRRGYHTALQCMECGEPVVCPHCSLALTYHAAGAVGMRCHCCGYRAPVPRACPSCGSPHLSFSGYGTQKAETRVQSDLPGLRVMRMDADTTSGKQSYDRLIESFRRGDADVLLGTQMVTKGHEFPRVTLVGVLLADRSLYVNDFRAAERTFSLLTQVIGRAGRSSDPGVALIQTFAPHNEVIRCACTQDYERFFDSEIELRRETMFPPFCDLARLTLTAGDEPSLFAAASALSDAIRAAGQGAYADVPMTVFGPFEAGVYKAAEKYRMQMIVKCRLGRRARALFRELLVAPPTSAGVTLGVDFNPLTFS
ncbi:MAG: primosomal protein N' [Clostridia bacterium]|nr:primosomal protein N' [Clostridia bacterium]